MKPIRETRRAFLLPAWWLAGGIFLLAGILKLRSLPGFLVAVEGYRLVPFRLAVWLAIWMPWLEIVCAICLVSGFWRRPGAVLLTATLVVFTAAVASAWARGLDIECGCFTAGADSRVGPTVIARNACLLCLLWPACLFTGSPRCVLPCIR